MKTHSLDLTYCLNVHPGESWTENRAAIRDKALSVKRLVAPDAPFGLGLRLGNRAARELANPQALDEALDIFRGENLYAFTINGFPYGRFHDGPVKEQVYHPDWRTQEREEYTILLANILAALLPDDATGSISTVPCSFASWVQAGDDSLMAARLANCAAHLDAIRERTGKVIHLGLEPEPCCHIETTEQMIHFFNDSLLREGVDHLVTQKGHDGATAEEVIRRHLGVCLDTCHTAIQFEDVTEALRRYRKEGIRVSKVQISAALKACPSPESLAALRAFDEPVYLHQVKARCAHEKVRTWIDLPDALHEFPLVPDVEEMRVHFHVPLFFEGSGPLRSTATTLDAEFFSELISGATSHLEIETYTFDVLPQAMRQGGVVASIAREYEWVADKLKMP